MNEVEAAESFTNQNFESSDWMNTEEAALYLRILSKGGKPCVGRIRNLVSLGKIPFYKPFGRLLFKRSELKIFIESSRKGGFKWR
ncbi:MAG: helix-turn-helix domain-containing protein [Deltaproteobacteria bacterium]|nr:helix-turn-helix domain-containing protein [Deltaproteobacteria bacterium]